MDAKLRTTQKLNRIIEMAALLITERGDTEWSDEGRASVDQALQALRAARGEDL